MKLRTKLGALALTGAGAALVLSGAPALAGTHSSSAVTGPESISGILTGKAVLGNAPKIPVKWKGLVVTHSVVTLGGNGSPHVGSVKMLPSPAGTLTVQVSSKPTAHQSFNDKSCLFSLTEEIPVNVLGSKSTGAFAGSSGPGAAKVHFQAYQSRYQSGPKKGQCNPNGRPLAKGAFASFLAAAVLTVP